MKHYGTIDLDIMLKDYMTRATFFVAETPGPIILGLPSTKQMKIITIHQIKTQNIKTISDLTNMYPERLENLECTYHIVTDTTIPPVVHAPRRTLILMIHEIKEELDQIERTGIIEKVREPTDWVSSLVYVRKQSGKIKIFLDPRYINKAIQRLHYPMKTIDDISYKIKGSNIFSKLEVRRASHGKDIGQSSLKTTFISPHGRYRFKRLPFGVCLSQDVFKLKMDMIIENCPGTLGIADEISVLGKTESEHDSNLHHLMKRAQAGGLIFNKENCKIKQKYILFFGLIFNEYGAKPNPERITAIQDIKPPTKKTPLQKCLGIFTYPLYQTYRRTPLRYMINKDTEFKWTPSHEEKFNDIKDLICR